MKGYKVFNPDWTCRGRQYSCPGIFEQEGELELCKNGIHFCRKLTDCFNYYDFNPENKVAEVEAITDVILTETKCCTSKIKIIRELSWYEVLDLVNTGINNTGFGNSGRYNTGCLNTGNYNTGCWNTGNYNTGNWNTGNSNSGSSNNGKHNFGSGNIGNYNSGYLNSGDYNSGTHNIGSYNSSYYNTGNYNSGKFNTGYCNIGHFNTGNYNSGNYNTGNFNISNGNFGCFNTNENKMIFFNKQSDWTYEDWIESKANEILNKIESELKWIPNYKMTEEEKGEHLEYKTTLGYLKHRKKEELYSLRQEWWENLSEEDKEAVLSLPNFDSNIFKEITGIDVTVEK